MAKNTSRRGASRGGSKKQSRQVPGWVWLFTGVIGGLFVAFLVHLAQVQMEQGRTGGGDRTAVEKPQPEEKDSDGAAKDDQPKFDFYAVLPKMEVIVPKGEGDGDIENGQIVRTIPEYVESYAPPPRTPSV